MTEGTVAWCAGLFERNIARRVASPISPASPVHWKQKGRCVMAHSAEEVREEVRALALQRWLADGWLEDDFEEKGLMYRTGAALDLLAEEDVKLGLRGTLNDGTGAA